MILSNFKTVAHGKWILAGEHAVVRGHGALVFPILGKQLTLTYETSTKDLHADYTGNSGEDTHLLFWSVLEHGLQLLGRSINSVTGYFKIDNQIPIGVGMGASAALCVALTRWFISQSLLEQDKWQTFSQELEHLFHGKSSGLDIAGVAHDQGLFFKKGSYKLIQQAWQPLCYLSSCEQMGITSHCIQQVNSLWEADSRQAASIDAQMEHAVKTARQALSTQDANRLDQLAQAINSACDCFNKW